MVRPNGGIIGSQNTPSISVASGIWAQNDVSRARREGAWPGPTYNCDYLLAAGGGGGAYGWGSGGGGAGGFLSSYATTPSRTAQSQLSLIEGNTYTITVGAGGSSIEDTGYLVGGSSTNGVASSITASGLTTVTALGGGYGVSYYDRADGRKPGGDGGCGGGGGTRFDHLTCLGGNGQHPKVSLLLHMDGTDDATTFTDSGPGSHTVTAVGNAKTEDSQKVFGSPSLYLDGTGDRLEIANHADFRFKKQPFTVELRARWDSVSGTQTLIGQETDSGAGWRIESSGTTLRAYGEVGANWISLGSGATLAADTWYSIALVRDDDSFLLFLDGALLDTTTDKEAFYTYNQTDEETNALKIGDSSGVSQPFAGYIDEVRITRGHARYTAAYTPATSAFTDGADATLPPNTGQDGGFCNGYSGYYGAPGGGGASAEGTPSGGGTDLGHGGAGYASSITGSSLSFSGGGGGGMYDGLGVTATGGSSVGGSYTRNSDATVTATEGTVNTGGGGAGTQHGGSGVVILRMATSDYTGTTTGSPTVTTDGSDTIIKFTSSGTYSA